MGQETWEEIGDLRIKRGVGLGEQANDAGPAVMEDYRTDRAILEEISQELARLHRRLDEYEPHARRLIDNPLARLLRARQGTLGRSSPHG